MIQRAHGEKVKERDKSLSLFKKKSWVICSAVLFCGRFQFPVCGVSLAVVLAFINLAGCWFI